MAGQGDYGQSTGYPELDAILPGCGWPRNALVEIISPHWGMGELQLLIPLMRSVIAQNKWILWISPPYLLYAPALIQAGIDTGKVLVVHGHLLQGCLVEYGESPANRELWPGASLAELVARKSGASVAAGGRNRQDPRRSFSSPC